MHFSRCSQAGWLALAALTLCAAHPADAQLNLRLTSFQAPNTDVTYGSYALGVSANGTVVGSYPDNNQIYHGYIRNSNGAFTSFDYPGTLGTGAFPGTEIGSINNAGDMTGDFVHFDNQGNVLVDYFIYHNGSLLSPQVVGSDYTAYNNVNEAGQVAVVYGMGGHSHSAIYDLAGGSLSLLPDVTGYADSFIQSILPNGGVLQNVGNGVIDPVTGEPYTRGSLTLNGVTTFFDYPGALDTRLDAMTSTGLMSGNYLDANHNRHGFVYDTRNNQGYSIDGDPSAIYTTLRLGNSDTQFAGFWFDANFSARSLVVSVVPEPGALALFVGMAGSGLVLRRRKRQQ